MKSFLLFLAAFLLSLLQVGAVPYEGNELVARDEQDGPAHGVILVDGKNVVAVNNDAVVVDADDVCYIQA